MQQHCEHSNKPARELKIVLNDGSTHVFDWDEVADVLRTDTWVPCGLLNAPDVCPESGLVNCGTEHCSIHTHVRHEGTDSVQQTQLTDFGESQAQSTTRLLNELDELEAQESPRRSLVGIHSGRGNYGTPSHCSRCRAPHRRAHIKRVAHNGHVTMRCFDCQFTGNQKAADLKAVRQAIFDEGREAQVALYEVERGCAGYGSTTKLRALMTLAKSLNIPVPGVEL